jgi:hypothetical protein
MIAPVLAEMRLRHADRCAMFSGTEFNVDPARGLRGYCDFILTRSPVQHLLTAPVLMVAEAKNDNLATGYGQCIAGMVAAQTFNEQRGRPLPVTYGAVSTGDRWQFLSLTGTTATFDMRTYFIDNVAEILGVLTRIVAG